MIKLYADGADMDGIITAASDSFISGFTTNPTLMRAAGITNYAEFAKRVISYLADKREDTNLSLEVFADDPVNILRQARLIDSWGDEYNYPVYVKIPVMHTDGTSTAPIINQLSTEGIKVNVTAVFTVRQIEETIDALVRTTPSIISVFAGRIADVGVNPRDIISRGILYYDSIREVDDKVEFLWASSREAHNYICAEACGCDIITMTPDLIKKVKGFGKDLTQFSKETCEMFYNDALKSGFAI